MIRMLDPNNIKMGYKRNRVIKKTVLMTRFLGSRLDNSQEFFNYVHKDVLELGASELLLEGGVAEYLLLLPELLHGNLLQGSGVMKVCREQNNE